MNPQTQAFYDRLSTNVSRKNAIGDIGGWVCKNTFLDGNLFSFKNHEFQKKIINDPSSRVNIRKCSQIGLSELISRYGLGYMAVSTGKRVILTLPTSRFATKFTKDRIDPVIDESPVLKGLLSGKVDSTEMKTIGSCTLYIAGTKGQSSAISIPANLLILDEIDFSDQMVLTTYSSRLRHAEADEHGFKGLIRRFSTPTVEGFGISKFFEASRQSYYFVRCAHCGYNHSPDFFSDCVLPGFEDDLHTLNKQDLEYLGDNILNAYIKCPRCGKNLTQSLLDPSKREWVEKFPDKNEAGYQVYPWDVPHYNDIPSIFLQMKEYHRLADWYNFCLGMTFTDAENSFLEEFFDKNATLQFLSPDKCSTINTIAGLDVGKTSHLVVAKRMGGTLHVVYRELIKASIGNPLSVQVLQRVQQFGVSVLCLDAAPDISTPLELMAKLPIGRVFAVEYTRSKSMAAYEVDEDKSIIKAKRTLTLDNLLKMHNSGKIYYPNHPCKEEFKEHFGNVKKVVDATENIGEMVYKYVKSGADHLCHAMNYLLIADSLSKGVGRDFSAASAPMVSTVKLGETYIDPDAPPVKPASYKVYMGL